MTFASWRSAVAAGACVALATGCDGRRRFSSSSESEPSTGPAIAVLDLSDGIPEQPPSGFLGLGPRGTSIEDVVDQTRKLEHDPEVRGVLVRLGGGPLGLGTAAEVGAALGALRAKLPVWCYADEYGNGSLLLAARGCDRIWVAPASSVDAVGLAAQTLYFHKLLADELGLDVDFLQVGKFKGAEEPFTRDGPSAEARASLESTLSGMRTAWLEDIRKGRARVDASTPEMGPYTPDEAKERGLVDDVGYFDDARTALERATGARRAEPRLGPGAGGDDLFDVVRSITGTSFSETPIVVVRASGAISMEGGGLLGSDGIVEHRLAGMLARLEHDDDVRAVVLRIDSPGGSALASDLLWHALMRLRSKKTLVVSIGDMAASGGYYLASSGAVVFADETSIVGSIGVVGGKIAADHALEKIGVHAETFPANASDAHAAPRAAYESLLMPWDDATRARVLETMAGIYQLFLQRVSEGRRIPVDKVAASAEGRIFSGRDARERGLIDEIGGLREAIDRARAMAGLPAGAGVGVADEPAGILGILAGNGASARGTAPLGGRLARTIADWGPFIDSVAPLAQTESLACALPFALTVR